MSLTLGQQLQKVLAKHDEINKAVNEVRNAELMQQAIIMKRDADPANSIDYVGAMLKISQILYNARNHLEELHDK